MLKRSFYRNKKEEQAIKRRAAARRKIEMWRECCEAGLNPSKDIQLVK